MNFDGAKENIQPLAAGRNVEQLEVALNAESHHECQEELLQQRKQFEQDIMNYVGDDPLDLWFEYVTWVEQSYPKSGKESSMDELLKKCLSTFEKDGRYAQDPRLVRLFIKYIDTKANPHLYYTKLYNNGVGTMVADLYIAWAHYYDLTDNFEQAKSVYQKGLDARAAPDDHLKQIYDRFQFSVGQRVVRKEEYRQEFLTSMEAQRNAFTSLRSLKRSKVGSIRTGSAVKSLTPGQVRQSMPKSALSSSNAPLNVYDGASSMAMAMKSQPPQYGSVVEEIEHSMVENKIEPGPWSKASSRKGVYDNVNRSSALKMAIHEDDVEQPPVALAPLPPDAGDLTINLPKNFVRKNKPQTPFNVPAYVEEAIEPMTLPCYNKFYLHPNEKICFQPEERRHYLRLKRQTIVNDFTKQRDVYWGVGNEVAARVLANFPRVNQPQTDMKTERGDITSIPATEHFAFNVNGLYPTDSETELTFDDLMMQRRATNNAYNNAGAMDETVCVRGRQSFGVAHTRKSIAFCGRKSIMPSHDDSGSDMEVDVGDEAEKAPTGVAHQAGEFAPKVGELPATKWSIFTDDEPSAIRRAASTESKSNEKVQSPEIFSVFKNVGSSVNPSDSEIFAIPQRPVSRPAGSSDRRTLDSPLMRTPDLEIESKSAPPASSPYPFGPQTGVIKKLIRKSSIAENAIPNPVAHHPAAMQPTSSNGIALKAPQPELDQSLCTQAFNFNLVEQMVSTPVAAHRPVPMLAHETQMQPLKLSTIMETTEGSTHTASTKSSIQFSSPEDDDMSKRSNVTLRRKTAGDSDAREAGKNDSNNQSIIQSESIGEFAKIAGSTLHSCNDENTLPAIQMSTIATAAANEGPSKKYPFPIFEDTEATTTIGSSSELQGQSLTTTVKPLVSSDVLSAHPKTSSTETIDNSNRSTNDRFNQSSLWIKDEPQSFSLMESVAEQSFALPTQPSGSIFGANANNVVGFAVPEESFALPSYRMPFAQANRTVASDTVNSLESFGPQQFVDDPQTDASVTEESFALPRSRKSLAPANRTVISETDNNLEAFGTQQSNDDLHTDSSVTEESFALPRSRKSLAPANRTVVSETDNNLENFGTQQSNDDPHTDSSVTEESFALPRSRKSLAAANRTVFSETDNNLENFGTQQSNDDPHTDASVTEESFALPRSRKSLAPANRTVVSETDNNLENFAPQPGNLDMDTSESMGQPGGADETFDSFDSEEEIIEVPDETLLEDGSPKIVSVQSLASQNRIAVNHDDMTTRISISLSEDEFAAHLNKKAESKNADAPVAADCDQSIYYKHNSILAEPTWIENEAESDAVPAEGNAYHHESVNLEESRLVIETKIAQEECDPFDEGLRTAILQDIQFTDYLMGEETIEMVNAVPTVVVKRTIPFKESHFEVLKCIGHGAFGRVYHVKHAKSGRYFAVKKQKPAYLFEFYMLREVHRRVAANLSAYMHIDMAVIGNDGSLLFSEYSPYGTLLDVCNRVFTSIKNNINETIVAILAYQMLDIVGNLHKAGILHCDLKPDNFLVMRRLSKNHQDSMLQLIDFGNAIDLQRFPPGQQFTAALETKHFVCIEMLENRPWRFQHDCFCLAATIHAILFGNYLEVLKKGPNFSTNVKIPRYFNGKLWTPFFNELINVPENTTPDLQAIKDRFDAEIIADKKLEAKILEFNRHVIHL